MSEKSMINNSVESSVKKPPFFSLDPNREMLSRNFFKLLWIFCIMSIAGLVGETLEHIVEYGELEHRAGLVWGPFSPIYGSAAAFMLLILEPIIRKPWPILFLVAAVVGGVVEFGTHWAMEEFWGVVAWSYHEAPLNFAGRTDVEHCIIWGAVGLLWIKVGVPLFDKLFSYIDVKSLAYKALSVALTIFFVFNIFFTIASMIRADERAHEIPANDPIDAICDTYFTDDYLRDRFNNMGGLGIK